MSIHVDVIPILKDRDVQREADKLASDFERAGQSAGDKWGDGFGRGIQRASPKIQKSFNAVEAATIRATQAQREYDRLNANSPGTEAAIRAAERLTIARNTEADSHRNAAAVLRQHTQAARESDSAMENITDSLQTLGTQAFRTSRGIATIAAPAVIAALWETGRVAVSASQSLAALPAVATAAAAGIGTLKIATMGFNQAMSDIGDLDKFNADLVQLGPNAAAAALEIRNNFIPVFDQIQRAAEDKLFNGVAQRLEQLKTAFAPGIQGLTTSIANSLNQMALGASGTLLSPQNMASIGATMDNISAAFQNAAPAAGMFTQALTDIINVGSQFLPELGTSITDMAADFSAFISRVSSSGELHDFIADGIESTKALGGAVLEVGQFVYDTFGGISQGEVQAWSNQVKDALTTITPLVFTINTAFKIMNSNILDTGKSLSDLVNPLTAVVSGVMDLVNNADDAKQSATDQLNEARARMGQPPVDVNGNVMPGQRPVPQAPGYSGSRLGFDPFPTTPSGLPVWGSPTGTTAKPPKPPKPSDRERLDAIRAGLDPASYHVDPFGQVPGLPGVPLPANAGLPGSYMPPSYPGGPGVDPQDALEARQNVERQAHDLEEARKDRLALEQDNETTAEQLNDAREKETRAAQDLQRQQADLAKKLQGTAQDVKKGTTELSAALDPDLGLGRGLAGLADNLVRFVGHLALAPQEAQWQQTIDQTEAATGIKGGYGLLGMRGANNLSQGLSPLLGRPMPAGTTQSGTTSTSPSFLNGAMTNATTSSGVNTATPTDTGQTRGYAGLTPAAKGLEAVVRQQFPMLGDIGGQENRPAGTPQGHTKGLALDINIPNWDTPAGNALGDQINAFLQSNAGALGLQQTIWENIGTEFPGGGKFNEPGHMNHIHAAVQAGLAGAPGGPLAAGPASGMPGTGAPSLGSGVVPVYVTNMGGMGAGGAAAALPGGAPSGLTPAGQAALTGGPAGAGAERWRGAVQKIISQYGPQMGITPGNSKAWEDAIVKQIDTESKGDPTAQNPNDSNGQGGTQSVSGLLQYLPSSYANSGGKLTGRPLMDPLGQIAGALFAPRTAGGLPDTSAPGGIGAGHGWGPTSYTPKGGTNVPPNLGGGQGGGPGPYIPGITPKPPAYQDPHLDPRWSGPGIGAGLGAPSTTDLNSFGPPGGPGGSPPGSIGGIPVPPGVTAPGGPPPGLSASPAAAFNPSTGGPGADTTKIGGLAAPDSINPGGTGFGIMPGGTIDSLIQGGLQAAGGAAGPFGGGAGGAAAAAAAQTLMKLANRAIQFGGEAAGIGVSGLMETFLPTGGSELAQNNWLTRIAGAVGAAAPALPNLAGGALGQQQQQGPLTPEQIAANGNQHGMANGAAPGPQNINITQNNNQGLTNAEQAAGAIADHQRTANAGPMGGIGVRP